MPAEKSKVFFYYKSNIHQSGVSGKRLSAPHPSTRPPTPKYTLNTPCPQKTKTCVCFVFFVFFWVGGCCFFFFKDEWGWGGRCLLSGCKLKTLSPLSPSLRWCTSISPCGRVNLLHGHKEEVRVKGKGRGVEDMLDSSLTHLKMLQSQTC